MRLVSAFHHVSLAVTDLARSRRFYAETLGLRELERPAFDFAGAWFDLGASQQLHLIVAERPRALRGTTEIDSRDGHFALRIVDHRAAVAHLRAHGVVFRDKTDNATPWTQIFLTDPDGNGIELNAERPEG
jgi:glyoxylase I family protein